MDLDEQDVAERDAVGETRSPISSRGWRELLQTESESIASDREAAIGFLRQDERSEHGSWSVLLVEDTDVDAQITTVLLRRALGKQVDITRARTVRDAAADLTDHRFDLVLLDMGLPDGRGLDVLDRICEAAQDETIVILSGNDDRHMAIDALRDGAQDYLIKGTFDPETFGRTLRHAVARSNAELQARWATAKLLLRSDQLATEIERRTSVERRLRAEALRVGEANLRLRELDRAKSLFLAKVSHELRTPLCSIAGYAELLEMEMELPGSSEAMHAVDAINRNCDRLLHLVEQLLVAGQVASGLHPPVLRATDPAALLHACAEVVAPVARQPIEIHAVDLPDVMMDSGQIERAVINLLDNARKFSPADATITVTARCIDNASIWISVSDEGPGVPADEQASVFDSFTRGEQAVENAVEGSGLGLGIANAIVTAHGGSLSLASPEGEGSTFTIALPLAGPEVPTVERPLVEAIDAP